MLQVIVYNLWPNLVLRGKNNQFSTSNNRHRLIMPNCKDVCMRVNQSAYPLCRLLCAFASSALAGGRDKQAPRLLPHECCNYKTWLTAIISIFKPSNRTSLRWHSSISVSSIGYTHLRPPSGWLACETLVLTPVFSFIPSTRPNSKTFNFHVLKKRYHAPLRYGRSSFISANTTFKLVTNHASKNKRMWNIWIRSSYVHKKIASRKNYNF